MTGAAGQAIQTLNNNAPTLELGSVLRLDGLQRYVGLCDFSHRIERQAGFYYGLFMLAVSDQTLGLPNAFGRPAPDTSIERYRYKHLDHHGSTHTFKLALPGLSRHVHRLLSLFQGVESMPLT